MKSVTLRPLTEKLVTDINLPLSKSISNRALIISALSRGSVDPGTLSSADDTKLMAELLFQSIEGKNNTLHAANSGTVFRFLTAYLSIQNGEWILDGDERMRQRPVAPLVNALKQLGVKISYLGKRGYPPLKITGSSLKGGDVSIASDISSQYISALMMIGPLMKNGLRIRLDSTPVSLPYIQMTESLMLKSGAKVVLDPPYIHISGSGYGTGILPHEADWSAATFWYELFCLSREKSMFLNGLQETRLQGDSVVLKYFRLLGVETDFRGGGAWLTKFIRPMANINAYLSDHPDLAPALIVATAARRKAGNFYGMGHLRHKESDRIHAIIAELNKTGIQFTVTEDSLTFEAQKMNISEAFDTYADHRMAMAFAPLAILGQPVTINNPEVVSKSYPDFWEELRKVLSVEI